MTVISVIVPIYNAEKYIEECVSSIINQSFPDFELLLIDDGSTDSSGALCDSFAEKDSRIKVFHKQNGGVSSARNLGIEKSVGEWIAFVDSDDFIGNNYLKSLFENTLDCDIVSCGFVVTDENGKKIKTKKNPEGTFYKKNIVDIVNNDWIVTSPWAHLIKASLIKDNSIKFYENRSMGEDTIFVLSCLDKAGCIRNIPELLYYYRTTPNSLLHPDERKYGKYIEDYMWSNNIVYSMRNGLFYFYYKMRCHALMTSLYKKDMLLVKRISKESQEASGKKMFRYWLNMSLKSKILMSYIFFPKFMQFFVMISLFKICLRG